MEMTEIDHAETLHAEIKEAKSELGALRSVIEARFSQINVSLNALSECIRDVVRANEWIDNHAKETNAMWRGLREQDARLRKLETDTALNRQGIGTHERLIWFVLATIPSLIALGFRLWGS